MGILEKVAWLIASSRGQWESRKVAVFWYGSTYQAAAPPASRPDPQLSIKLWIGSHAPPIRHPSVHSPFGKAFVGYLLPLAAPLQ